MGRLAWLLLVLAVPMLVPPVAATAVTIEWLRVPEWASRGGEPFTAEIAAFGPPGAEFDLRAEFADEEGQASRFWNGTGWQSSQRYAPFARFDEDGRWRGLVRIAANADAANYDRVTGGGGGMAQVRVRVDGSSSDPLSAEIAWFGGDRGPTAGEVAGLAPDGTLVEIGSEDGVAALAAADGSGAFHAAVPAGAYVVEGHGAAEPVVVAPERVAWVGPPPPGQLQIAGFAFRAFDSSRDDVVEICSVGDEDASLAGVALRDGEGELEFPAVPLAAGACAVAAGNAETYERLTTRRADLTWQTGGVVSVKGSFSLGTGDELELVRHGRVVDVIVWGEGDVREGWEGDPLAASESVGRWFRRQGADTNSSADWWSLRPYRLGQSEFPSPPTPVDDVRAFVAPDSSYAAFAALIDAARDSVLIEVYDFTNDGLAGHLVRALEAGNVTRVRLVVEDAPVGRTPESRDRAAAVMERLQAAGADVRIVAGNRYTFHHGKAAVVDGRWSLVASENMNGHGFPTANTYGNRGWGVIVDSPAFARQLRDVLDWDATDAWTERFDVAAFAPDRREPLFALPAGPYRPRFAEAATGPATARLVLAPEHTVPPRAWIDAIDNASEEVLVQSLTLAPFWRTDQGDVLNPLLVALLRASERGVSLRVMLAGDFVDPTDTSPDNLDSVRILNAHRGNGSVEARLANPEELGTVHNKGLVVDRRVVFVGSLNGNLHSASRNREIGVLLDSEAAASHFAAAFDRDWDAWGEGGGVAGGWAPRPGHVDLALVATLFTVTLVLLARRRREAPPPTGR